MSTWVYLSSRSHHAHRCLVLSRLISFSYYPVGSHPATACTRAAIPGVDTVGNVLAAAEKVGLSVHLGLAFAESSRIPPWMNSTEYFRTYAGLNWEVRLPSLFSHCLSLCCCCRCRARTRPSSFDRTVRRISFIVYCLAHPRHACLCRCEGHSTPAVEALALCVSMGSCLLVWSSCRLNCRKYPRWLVNSSLYLCTAMGWSITYRWRSKCGRRMASGTAMYSGVGTQGLKRATHSASWRS
jgi:hypothetical protein